LQESTGFALHRPYHAASDKPDNRRPSHCAQRRHYLLKSAYPTNEHRFHVAVQPSRLSGYRLKLSDRFALVFYKPNLPDTCAYIVIPFVRVSAMFTEARRDAKDGGWNAYVTAEGRFRTSADRSDEIDVTDCRSSRALPQRILQVAAHDHIDAEIEGALQELSRR
jgi:hypothetical protein